MIRHLRDLTRASLWLWLALALMAVVVGLAPERAGLFIWFLAKIAMAAYAGYWIARGMDRGPRPHEIADREMRHAAVLRRNLIVAACIVAAGLTP
jgi:hypothetical protein